MRILRAFILISAVNLATAAIACGPFYPYGEEVRFSIFRPASFSTTGFTGYLFSAHEFLPDDESVRMGTEMNLALWAKRADQGIPLAVIEEGVYDFKHAANNAFLQSLKKKKDAAALNYLKFADKCSSLNLFFTDPWEREGAEILPERSKLIRTALSNAGKLETKDEDLSRRYAFLAIRLAFYNGDEKIIQSTYDRYFSGHASATIIDYWSLYFRAVIEQDPAQRNLMIARVFANAPDKRFVIQFHYDRSASMEESLNLAKTAEDKSAVWAFYGANEQGKVLDNIRMVEELTPKSPMLTLLVLREVNKLEDWIFTPYFSDFEPSISGQNYYYDDEENSSSEETIKADREYAAELLTLLKTFDLSEMENPNLVKTSMIYLNYMAGNEGTLQQIREFESAGITDQALKEQLDQIKALCLVSDQKAGLVIIPEEVKPILVREHSHANNRFLFAVARELEYKGNSTDAAILLSKINNGNEVNDYGVSQFWKSKNGFRTLYSDVYDDYFFYLDADYTNEQVSDLIAAVEKGQNSKDPFDQWKFSNIIQAIPRLYDLLGTKLLRKNELDKALSAFVKVEDNLWKSYPYVDYLDANPFYTNFYNEHARTEADKVRFNKETLIRKLIFYREKAEDPATENRDYYCFLVANAYFNMTHHGNSWLMKRYYWSTNDLSNGLEDDEDYYECKLAKKWYLKAKSVSKSPKFRALCLRMAGRCEKYRLYRQSYEHDDNYENIHNDVFNRNNYYKQLKQEYPDDYDELISNCESFDAYFQTYK